MEEKEFDAKYGMDSSRSDVQNFHAQRRMFAIKDNLLYLAPARATYSHAKWFELEGWMTSDHDDLMNSLTRGYTDPKGVYFYVGYDFEVTEDSETEMLYHLDELVLSLSLNPSIHLYGGKIKCIETSDWPARKNYGSLYELLDICNGEE